MDDYGVRGALWRTGAWAACCVLLAAFPSAALSRPIVAITAPADQAAVSAGETWVTARFRSDSARNIVRLELSLDGQLVQEYLLPTPLLEGSKSFPLDMTSRPAGPHTFTVRALDAAGEAGQAQASVTLSGGAQPTLDRIPPVITIFYPAQGATVAGRVVVRADASDNAGVRNVVFLVDGKLHTILINRPPFTANWDTTGLSEGPHILEARAKDAADNEGFSAPVTVIVQNTGAAPTPATAGYTPPATRGPVTPPGPPQPTTPQPPEPPVPVIIEPSVAVPPSPGGPGTAVVVPAPGPGPAAPPSTPRNLEPAPPEPAVPAPPGPRAVTPAPEPELAASVAPREEPGSRAGHPGLAAAPAPAPPALGPEEPGGTVVAPPTEPMTPTPEPAPPVAAIPPAELAAAELPPRHPEPASRGLEAVPAATHPAPPLDWLPSTPATDLATPLPPEPTPADASGPDTTVGPVSPPAPTEPVAPTATTDTPPVAPNEPATPPPTEPDTPPPTAPATPPELAATAAPPARPDARATAPGVLVPPVDLYAQGPRLAIPEANPSAPAPTVVAPGPPEPPVEKPVEKPSLTPVVPVDNTTPAPPSAEKRVEKTAPPGGAAGQPEQPRTGTRRSGLRRLAPGEPVPGGDDTPATTPDTTAPPAVTAPASPPPAGTHEVTAADEAVLAVSRVVFRGKVLGEEVRPEVRDGAVMISLKHIFEAADGALYWFAAEKRARAVTATADLGVQIGSTRAVLNGESLQLPTAPVLKNSRILVPLALAARALNLRFDLDPTARQLTITSG